MDGATLVGSALTIIDTITVVDGQVSAADADTLRQALGDAVRRGQWLHKPNPQTSPLPPSMSPLWMATLVGSALTTDTITVVDAASVSIDGHLGDSLVMQARSRSVVTQTKPQTSPLPRQCHHCGWCNPVGSLSPLPTPSPLSMQPV